MHLISYLIINLAAWFLLVIHKIVTLAGKVGEGYDVVRKRLPDYIWLALRVPQWLIYLPLHVFLVVFIRPWLAWVAVKYFSTPNKLQLVWWLDWFMTGDNPLSGDQGWQTEYIPPGSDPLSDENRIAWLQRNGGNNFNFHALGCKADMAWALIRRAFQTDEWFWVRPDGYWMLRCYIPFADIVIYEESTFHWWPTVRYLNLYWGWSLFGVVDGRNKFTFTTRIKEVKP